MLPLGSHRQSLYKNITLFFFFQYFEDFSELFAPLWDTGLARAGRGLIK
jgi:hypothetical protein